MDSRNITSDPEASSPGSASSAPPGSAGSPETGAPAPGSRPKGSPPPDRSLWIFVGAIVVFLVIHLLPAPAPLERGGNVIPLTMEGKACLAIMVFAVILWVTETVPFAVTSLFVVLLIPLLGLADYRRVVQAAFGAPIITFFIGVLMLSAGFTRSGLGSRLVYQILGWVGTRTDRVLLGVLVVGSLLSWWITDMAAAAMLLPVGVGLLQDAGLEPGKSNFGRSLMIATAFGSLIGGIATPAGTAANLMAMGQLDQLAGVQISFLRWMAYGVPASLLTLPLAWWILLKVFPPELEQLPITKAEIDAKLAAHGRFSSEERWTLFVFLTVIVIWVTTPFLSSLTGGRFAPPIESVALGGGLALFLPRVRVMSWKEAESDIEWGGIMLIAAGLSLGLVVFESGAARWLAWVLLGQITLVPHVLQAFIIVLAVAGLHLMFSSNTVTASIIAPILVALAQDLGLDLWAVLAPAAFTSSLAFILVSEGPTTIIPYASGYFSIKDMAKAGLWVTVAAAACVTVSVWFNQLLGT